MEERGDAISMVVIQLEGVLGKPSRAFRRVVNPYMWGTIALGHKKVKELEATVKREMGKVGVGCIESAVEKMLGSGASKKKT